jgi:hypothetical protein
MELVTVFGTGTLAVWILYQIVRRDSARYYWIVVLSTAELYGGYVSFFFWLFWLFWPCFWFSRKLIVYHVLSWMTFGPEWVAGSPNLDTSNPLYLWVYLFVSFPQPFHLCVVPREC